MQYEPLRNDFVDAKHYTIPGEKMVARFNENTKEENKRIANTP
jgi:hypothetical protein